MLWGRSFATQKEANKESKKDDAAAAISQTLLLPATKFSMRANAAQREPQLMERTSRSLYRQQAEAGRGEKTWTLHDGPPYANGVPHVGHALNKILKDVINRWKVLAGHRVSYVPGWDCHGLPIEIKALQELDVKPSRAKGTTGREERAQEGERELSAAEAEEEMRKRGLFVRKKARQVAMAAVKQQKQCFERWGVMGEWENPYLTLQPEYEAAQLEVFRQLWKKGVIYKGRKPVHWSPSSRTALAEAELEYPPSYISKSVFVRFPLLEEDESVRQLRKIMLGDGEAKSCSISLAIWTTTPWTLPANMAVCVHEDMEYVLVKNTQQAGGLLLLAKERVKYLSSMLGGKGLEEVGRPVAGSALVGVRYKGFVREGSVFHGSFVSAESGTGVVHAAPGHGQEDFALLARQHGMEAICPVDDDGCFTGEVGNDDLVGLAVLGAGNKRVIEQLEERELLLCQHDYDHKYPHDWRTKKPVILRATEQWFADVRKLVPDALASLKDIEMVPGDSNKSRLAAFLQQREDWCISRQRAWGVPIPVFFDLETKEQLIDDDTIEHFINLVKEKGTDCWWYMDVKDLLPPKYRNNGREYGRRFDTVDVWFDSGSSWSGVLESRGLPCPADMYFEGSDQHRGWFQSSLLTAVGVRGFAPYKRLVTHGFVLDEAGRKMSKSIGNVVDPQVIVLGGKDVKKQPAYGADVLRSWAASSDYTKDVTIGDNLVAGAFEALRKIRNTSRFLLGNLQHFEELLPYGQMRELDRYMLACLVDNFAKIQEHYDAFQTNKVMLQLQQFCAQDLSAFYFEAVKDRLYADAVDSVSRRSAERTLVHCLDVVNKSIAPVACFVAEDIWEHTPSPVKKALGTSEADSVFMSGLPQLDLSWRQPELKERWDNVKLAKATCNVHLEQLRKEKAINGSVEGRLVIKGCPDASPVFRSLLEADAVEQLHLVLGVSMVDLEKSSGLGEELSVTASRSSLAKCVRCWLHTAPASEGPPLCSRCAQLL